MMVWPNLLALSIQVLNLMRCLVAMGLSLTADCTCNTTLDRRENQYMEILCSDHVDKWLRPLLAAKHGLEWTSLD